MLFLLSKVEISYHIVALRLCRVTTDLSMHTVLVWRKLKRQGHGFSLPMELLHTCRFSLA